MNLLSWLNYIGQLHVSAIDMGLQRILPIAVDLRLTHFPCPVIIVGGTNGKGSVVRALEAMYSAAGYVVGAYTSPHLFVFNERLRINDQAVEDAWWIKAFTLIEVARAARTLSFFEYTTLAALWICQQHALDILILEVGLGGRLDAVNIVDRNVAVVTNIDLDHENWLGDSREKIGVEKAGIFHSGGLAVCGDPDPPQSLLQLAQQHQVALYRFQQDYRTLQYAAHWDWVGPDSCYRHLSMPRLKLQNMATAIMVAQLVALPISSNAVAQGVQHAALPGRYEVCHGPCKMIFDVAHNGQSAQYLADKFATENVQGRRYAVVGMLADKNHAATLQPLVSQIDAWYVASLSGARGLSAVKLAAVLTENQAKNCYTFETVGQALQAVLNICRVEDVILIFGSFHTVAEARHLLLKEHT